MQYNNFKLPFPRLYINATSSPFEEYLEKFIIMTKLQIPSKLDSSQIFRNGNIMCYFLAHKGTFLLGEEKELF